MAKTSRAFFGIGFFFLVLAVLPLSVSSTLRSALLSFLKVPAFGSSPAANFMSDLIYFRRNAEENRSLKKELSDFRAENFRVRELSIENERLVRLLELKHGAPPHLRTKVAARVIARSPVGLDRVFVIDKGRREGIRNDMLVLSELSVIGKVIESAESSAKALLMNDPGFRLGVLLQRTRQQGVLYGFSGSSGECRVKYLSLELEIRPGDVVETAGFGGFVPKGLPVGIVKRTLKIPGQIYQTAVIQPSASLDRVEEVLCVD